MKSVFDLGIEDFVEDCAAAGANAKTVRETAAATLAHLKGSAEARGASSAGQALEARWYASLKRGKPDYSVYAEDAYLGELWACWVVYSRQYLKNINRKGSLSPGVSVVDELRPIKSIVDIGCGTAHTCAALVEIFPEANVVGVNIEGTIQSNIAKRLGEGRGFRLTSDLSGVGVRPVDLVFASEFFEHVEAPIHYLRGLLDLLRPRALLVANTFNAPSIGHFKSYAVDGKMVPGPAASRAFGRELRASGYEKVKTKLWNSRPALWWRRRVLV